jgi:hypothetical protein
MSQSPNVLPLAGWFEGLWRNFKTRYRPFPRNLYFRTLRRSGQRSEEVKRHWKFPDRITVSRNIRRRSTGHLHNWRPDQKAWVGYKIAITWLKNEPDLTCNLQMEKESFWNLVKRFERDPAFEKDHRAAMKKTLDKGYPFRDGFRSKRSAIFYLSWLGSLSRFQLTITTIH